MPKSLKELTLKDLVDALSEVLLTEFPSIASARLAAWLVKECRNPSLDTMAAEALLRHILAGQKRPPKQRSTA